MLERSGKGEEYSCILVEQYVSEVLDFSSQYGSDNSISYTAHNIVGLPTKFPEYGDFSQTFALRDYGAWWTDCPSGRVWRRPYPGPRPQAAPAAQDFIDIKFEHPVFPFRIHIYETYNPGGVVAIWAGDCQGGWKLLWDSCQSRIQETVSQRPRIFSPPLRQIPFPSRLLRLEVDQSQLPYYTEIDAVSLLGTLDPMSREARVNAMLPDRRGPIFDLVVKRRLHLLPPLPDILSACAAQLSRGALADFVACQAARELRPPDSDLGALARLPREILVKVLGYLDLVSLARMGATCSRLYQLAQDPFLYTVVDLRQIFYTASSDTLRWLGGRCSNMSRLDLSCCGNYGKISPLVLEEFLVSSGSGLSSVRLDSCHVATATVLECLTSCCPGLQEVSLANCHLLNIPDFHPIAQLENLVSLNLYRTAVDQTTVISILCTNRNLRHLSLAACPNIDGDEVCIYLSHWQPQLECLDLWRCSSLTDRGVAALTTCSRLRDIDLGWCLNVPAMSGALVQLVEACTALERVYLTAHRETGDKELRALAKLKNLRQLDVLGNRNVSVAAVQELLKSCPDLRLLDCSFCEQLKLSIRQLRLDYPHVTIQWSFTADTS